MLHNVCGQYDICRYMVGFEYLILFAEVCISNYSCFIETTLAFSTVQSITTLHMCDVTCGMPHVFKVWREQ